MESSWGFLCADAVHLHCEETILGHHFLLSMAHSARNHEGSPDTQAIPLVRTTQKL